MQQNINICKVKDTGKICTFGQGCGSGFRDFVDPDPYWESGSGSRDKKTTKFQWKNALFSYFLK
jgi:hypothetical protein